MIMVKKGYNISIKTKIPLILIFSLCSIFIISQILRFVNIFRDFFEITFREVEKVSIYTRELFYVHLYLVNFPDKHCICVHKSKIRHTPFEIYRIFETCPLGDAPIGRIFFVAWIYAFSLASSV